MRLYKVVTPCIAMLLTCNLETKWLKISEIKIEYHNEYLKVYVYRFETLMKLAQCTK